VSLRLQLYPFTAAANQKSEGWRCTEKFWRRIGAPAEKPSAAEKSANANRTHRHCAPSHLRATRPAIQAFAPQRAILTPRQRARLSISARRSHPYYMPAFHNKRHP